MVEVSYPGVYVEEVSSRVHPIEGVATSAAAFVVTTDEPESVEEALARREVRRPDRAVTASDFSEIAMATPGSGVSRATALPLYGRLFFENGGGVLYLVRVPAAVSLADALSVLDDVPDLGLLCLPGEMDVERLREALAYADRRRLFLLADPPGDDVESAVELSEALAKTGSANAAVFYPSLRLTDPATGGERTCGPSGAVAGLYARMDRARGVWAAPAGAQAILLGADGPAGGVTEAEATRLAAGGVNPIRVMPGGNTVVWGARTVQGADEGSEWKYVNVRRYATFLEQSIDRGTGWAVFEPNDEVLWARLQSRVADFLDGQWRSGALQGDRPDQAYFARCDRTTMTQEDLDQGRLNVVVGVAPVRPAEFVDIRVQKLIGGGSRMVTVTLSGTELGARLRLPHRPVLTEGFGLEIDTGSGWVAWTRLDDLGAAGADDRMFVLDPAAGEIRFGDGKHGARLPTGASTVRATYRRGAGTSDDGVSDSLIRRILRLMGIRST
jgi:phage tail sheath protein FI